MELHVADKVFNLRVATENELGQVLELLVGAAQWLQTKATTQWDYYMTDLEGNTKEVLDSIEKRNTYILEQDGEAAASVTLEGEPSEWDCDIWGEEAGQSDAVYLHRLVVNRKFAGTGIGEALMDWAKKQVRDQGKKCIRFDCLSSNEGLNRYYQRYHELKGIANIYGRHSKYEIQVDRITTF